MSNAVLLDKYYHAANDAEGPQWQRHLETALLAGGDPFGDFGAATAAPPAKREAEAARRVAEQQKEKEEEVQGLFERVRRSIAEECTEEEAEQQLEVLEGELAEKELEEQGEILAELLRPDSPRRPLSPRHRQTSPRHRQP